MALHNPKLKRIVWGVDFFSFDESRTTDRETIARLRGDPWTMFSETLLNLEALDAGRREFNRAWHGRKALRAGWTIAIPGRKRNCAGCAPRPIARALIRLAPGRFSFNSAMCRTTRAIGSRARKLRDYAAAVELARQRGVEVIAFVPPISG